MWKSQSRTNVALIGGYKHTWLWIYTLHNTGRSLKCICCSQTRLSEELYSRLKENKTSGNLHKNMIFFPHLVIWKKKNLSMKIFWSTTHIHALTRWMCKTITAIYFLPVCVSVSSLWWEMVSVVFLWSHLWDDLSHLLGGIGFAAGCTWHLLLSGICYNIRALLD